MGEIQKQSIKGTIFIYAGAALGFVISGVLYPRFLTTSEVGLISVLSAYALLFSQIASFGIPNILTRIFPYFRSAEKKNHGFLGFALILLAIGFVLAMVTFMLLKGYIIESEMKKTELLVDYIYLLPPFILATMLYILFDHYNKVLYNASRGILLKEFILRIFTISILALFIFKYISIGSFFKGYIAIQFIPVVIFIILLLKEGSFNLKIDRSAFTPSIRKEIYTIGLFGMISSASGTITFTLDRIMINSMMNLDMAGIYSICFFFGTLVVLPSRAISKTISTYISEAWKTGNIAEIKTIFRSSSINQLMAGALLIIGIWANMENIMIILTEDYRPGYYVILFIGLAFLSDMVFNPAIVVLVTSKKYKWSTYFLIILMVLVVVGNFIAIPLWSITGAAIASFGAKLIYNLIVYIYVWKQFKLQIFNYKFILIALSALAVYFLSTLIPVFDNYIIDILIRSSFIAILYLAVNYYLKSSSQMNNLVDKYLR